MHCMSINNSVPYVHSSYVGCCTHNSWSSVLRFMRSAWCLADMWKPASVWWYANLGCCSGFKNEIHNYCNSLGLQKEMCWKIRCKRWKWVIGQECTHGSLLFWFWEHLLDIQIQCLGATGNQIHENAQLPSCFWLSPGCAQSSVL